MSHDRHLLHELTSLEVFSVVCILLYNLGVEIVCNQAVRMHT